MAAGNAALSDRIVRTYYVITGLFNLAMSLIWGIDTLFKMGAGLDIQHVLLTNAAFTLGSMAWSGLTLLLVVPLYWIARRSDRRLDAIA